MTIQDLPLINACLNSLATVFLTLGFVFIKNGNKGDYNPRPNLAQIAVEKIHFLWDNKNAPQHARQKIKEIKVHQVQKR